MRARFKPDARRESDPVGRRPDPLVGEVDFPLPAMMRDMHIPGEQNFPPGQPAIGRVVSLAELLVGQVRDHARTVIKSTRQKLEHGVFVGCGR
jgi:hypothetical protein